MLNIFFKVTLGAIGTGFKFDPFIILKVLYSISQPACLKEASQSLGTVKYIKIVKYFETIVKYVWIIVKYYNISTLI